jgi:hypothetical protein
MPTKRKTGRPSSYSEDIAGLICKRLADGESLRGICVDDTMPDKATVLRWLADPKRTVFRDQYARARESQADALVEECIEIADDGTNDWMERRSEAEKGAGVNTGWVLNGEHVQRSRLRVDTRKWWAARLAPKKYGDKVTNEFSGPDGGAIPIERIERVIVTNPKNRDS